MTPFPHRYTVSLRQRELLAPPRAPIAAGPPPQFGGTDKVWSPEELLIGAVLECLWTTFESIARREGLTVYDWSGTADGVLDRGARGPQFTSIVLAVAISVDAADEARTRAMVAKAERACIISNALAVPVTVELSVATLAPAVAS